MSTQHVVVHSSQLQLEVEEKGRALTCMRWGFRDLFSQRKLLLNCRYENLETYYRDFLGQRCILVADGYYEWKDSKPYAVKSLDEGVMFIGALFRHHEGEMEFSVITCPCTESMFWLHDRQPAMIDEADIDPWLDPEISFDDAVKCLKTVEASKSSIYQVPDVVNSIKNNTPDCLVPLQEYVARQKATGISRFFQPANSQTQPKAQTQMDKKPTKHVRIEEPQKRKKTL